MKINARRVANYSECVQAGDFFITEPSEDGTRRLSFLCPCGCGDLCGIRVRDDGKQTDRAWGWNGDEVLPTCTPSIEINGDHWHGFLTDGVWQQKPK